MSEPLPEFTAWVEQAVRANLPQETNQDSSLRWQALSGDAGFRQYFRLSTQPPNLAVLSPPATENNEAFLAIAQYLREHGVRAPRVMAWDLQQGYMLVEDLGNDLLLDHLNGDTVDLLYGEALMTLLRLQQLPPAPSIFPDYSREKLRTEMNTFCEWFAERLLGYTMNTDERNLVNDLFQRLEDSACEQPQVIVHRDFHSRNLVHTTDTGGPGVIDFQDAVYGPMTYDLVSLLRDCYIEWPVERVERWALAYAGMAADVGILGKVPQDQFLRWFDWMGLQRHIKVLGVFARLSLRDGKHGYLNDLGRVISYVRNIGLRHPETAEFVHWFDKQLIPLAQRQTWYAGCAAHLPPLS